MKILLVNDDGYESPALIPTIESLKPLGDVTTVVPKRQQSWTSKINTRWKTKITLEKQIMEDNEVHILDAYPSDCANFGIFEMGQKPDLVVSGANLGHNVGIHAFFSSGTIGGAIDGVIAGIPSIAISAAYKPGQEMVADLFRTSLLNISKIINYFTNNRPSNFAMLNLNIPLGVSDSKIVATELDKVCFGSLFKKEDGYVIPRNYYDLNPPYSDKVGFDTWARKNGHTSVIAFDDRVQMIEREIVENWLSNLNEN